MRRRITFILLALLMGVSAVSDSAPSAAEEAVPLALTMPPMGEDCILTCDDEPAYCEPGEHDAWWVPLEEANADYGDGFHSIQHPCWNGTCENKHPACEPVIEGLAVEVEEVRVALGAGDVDRFETALRQLPERYVSLNIARQAVQFMDCTGRVLAHYPIPDGIAAHLLSE